MKTIIVKKNKGFTLIEALVAISILMIAIASPMTLAQKGLSTATLSKDQMIASFLAQDAMEAVKNIRDQIAISKTSGDWLDSTGIFAPCICSNEDGDCKPGSGQPLKFCTIDTTAKVWGPTSILAGDINNAKLRMATVDIVGVKHFIKYDYSGSDVSKFSRYINMNKDSVNPDEATVRVRVEWTTPQGVSTVDIKDYIYNYSENLTN